MVAVGIYTEIFGYTQKPRIIAYGATFETNHHLTIKDLVGSIYGEVRKTTGFKEVGLLDFLDKSAFEVNEKPVDLGDSLIASINNANKDELGRKLVRVRIEKSF